VTLKRIILVAIAALVASAMWSGTARPRQREAGQEIYLAAAASMAKAHSIVVTPITERRHHG